jgi:acetylornithine deacetylase
MPNTTPLIRLLCDLVAVNSVNPSLVAGAPGEREIAGVVADAMRRGGVDVELRDAAPGRPNVVGILEGKRPGRTLMLCGHTDTVGVAGMRDPFTPIERDGKLYGRGAQDMKSGVAAMIDAAIVLARDGFDAGRLIVAAVVDEEHSSIGADALVATTTADAAIVTEPTHGEVVIAHKGFVWSEITFRGRAAHGSRVDEGVDAITAAGPALVRLRALDTTLGVIEHPLLGRGSVHASLIAGGTELSSYPGECVLSLERRTLPGETAASVEAEIAGLIAGSEASARTLLVREPFAIDPEAEIVRLVRSAAGDAPVAGAPYWTDAAFIAAAGIPTVLYGPAGAGAHADEEWVSVTSVERVTETLIAVARAFCT